MPIPKPFYAIREKTTGGYLPASSRPNRSFTHFEVEKDCIPRLFKRQSDASSALNRWLEGKHFVVFPNPYEFDTDVVKVSTRIRENMEVVKVYLHIYSKNGPV